LTTWFALDGFGFLPHSSGALRRTGAEGLDTISAVGLLPGLDFVSWSTARLRIVGRVSNAATMNQLIAQRAARRSERLGLIDRLHGAVPLRDDRRDALNEAMAEAEAAIKRGDELSRDMADATIDRLLDEAREERQQVAQRAEQERQQAEQEAARAQALAESAGRPGFDGGVRQSVAPPPPTMSTVIRREVAARDALAADARARTR